MIYLKHFIWRFFSLCTEPPVNNHTLKCPICLAEDVVTVWLRPVEVFGVDPEESYGLSDAVPAWSDCNRARGHIFRVADFQPIGGDSDWSEEEMERCCFVVVRRCDLHKLWPDPEQIWIP